MSTVTLYLRRMQMPRTKVNTLRLNETRFLADVHNKEGRYVKRYYFSNGLGASVVCHDGSYGGHAGYFELAILKYPHGTDPEITSNIIYDTQINKDLGCVDVHGWLDFGEVHVMLQRIRNYNTGDYCYND
jgi:hypothetical protein